MTLKKSFFIFLTILVASGFFLMFHDEANALLANPVQPLPAPAGIPVINTYDEDFYINTYVYQPLARILISKISNSLQNSLLNKIGDTISDQAGGGKDPHFVTDWRNLILNSQGQGNDLFRSVLADTKLCPYFNGPLKQVFGADLFGGVIKNLGGSGSLTSVPGTPTFQYLNRCSLSSDIDVTAFNQDFTKGGWSAWLQLLQPQNNPLGVYANSLSEQTNQIALAEEAAKSKAIAYQGFLPNQKNGSTTSGGGGVCTVDSDCTNGQTCSGDAQSGGGVCVSSGGGVCTVDSDCTNGQTCSGDAQSGGGVCVGGSSSSPAPTPIPGPPSAKGCAYQGLLTRCTRDGEIVTPGSLFRDAAKKRLDHKLESLNLNGDGIDQIEALILLLAEGLLNKVSGQLDNLLSNTNF